MKKLFLSLTLFIASFTLLSCGQEKNTPQASETADEIHVLATFYPMYEFTRAVVGETGEVSLLIPAGTEPHDYEPSAKDMAKMADADAVIYNSHELETWVKNAEDSTGKNNFIEAAADITLAESADADKEDHHDEEEHHHDLDPHVWLDPVLASAEVTKIQEALSEKFPDLKATFIKNAEAYQEKLATLDEKFSTTLQAAKERTFVTQHAAFGYLAKRYNLVQEAVSGLSPNEEPSPNRLLELKKFVEEHHLPVIYFEENASSKVAEVLAKEAKVKTSVLNTLESVSEDEMAAGKDYFTIMEENLKNLQLSVK